MQVVIDEGMPVATFDLQNESGTFLTVEANDSVDSECSKATIESEGHETSVEDDDDNSISALNQALEGIT